MFQSFEASFMYPPFRWKRADCTIKTIVVTNGIAMIMILIILVVHQIT